MELREHLEKALKEFSTGAYYQVLIEAKQEYTKLTGQINDDDDNYGLRISTFSDWYLLQYRPQNSSSLIISDYLLRNKVAPDLYETFLNVNYSLFSYTGTNYKKQVTLKDILHNKKIILPKDHPQVTLIKGDLFTGRLLEYNDKFHLLNGIYILPQETKGILEKQCRKIRKLKDRSAESVFLYKTEYFATKNKHYGHLQIPQIFIY
ncbi:MAG: hypothetical protein ISR65_01320 [Bacteriovoracaceae bacterium]|nr:hypothetical protein [Bacteriovoracaceae bacterium]